MSLQTLTLTSLTALHVEAYATGRCYLSQGKVQSEEDFVVQVIHLNAHGYIKFIPLNAMRQMHKHISTTTYRKRRPDFTAL